MELISVTKENLEAEHICCAISNNNDPQVCSKKAWLAQRFDEGLVFLKGDVRGKCFIEYLPAQSAWAPIDAAGYMYIDCLWVSGQFKGQGNSNLLLDACLADSRRKAMRGVVVLSAKKKLPFLSDPGYLQHKGFRPADEAPPQYVLYYLPFREDAPVPRFRPQVGQPLPAEQGFVLYYTDQCPYTAKYVPLLQQLAQEHAVPFRSVHLTTAAEAQSSPAPYTTYSLYRDGAFLTHEILSEKKFLSLL